MITGELGTSVAINQTGLFCKVCKPVRPNGSNV